MKDELQRCKWIDLNEDKIFPYVGDFCLLEDHEGNYGVAIYNGKETLIKEDNERYYAVKAANFSLLHDVPFGFVRRWTNCCVNSTFEYFYLDNLDYLKKITDLYDLEDE